MTSRRGRRCTASSTGGASRVCFSAFTMRPPGNDPGAKGSRSHAESRHPRQPECEDYGKRGGRGYDAGKKVNGRKRHILVETTGLLLAVVAHAASIQDRIGAWLVLSKLWGCFPHLQRIWADAGYTGDLVWWVAEFGDWPRAIIRRTDKGLEVLPRHWGV